MPLAKDTEIERLTARFVDRTLPKPEWTHRAHFAVALALLRSEAMHARADMPNLIRAYNTATGVKNSDTEGYHETITLASLRAANSFLDAATPGTSLTEVLDRLMSSRYGRSDWLFEHWSRDRLFSVEARLHWCEPDLADLPF